MDTSDMWDYSKMTRNELANKASEIRLKIATLEDEIVALEMHRDVLKDELEKVSAAGEKELGR